ncbi:hypothetical protein SD70_09015 [Gordoniibacillus kamchatkensis]|uniref:Peptidase metallopeptidase domain-containing protein n=1 Tax=Gordoniibacillus kamchatkensis TaxID=1590651 RepID=A0ABR5AJF9_9BACL|nr:hypothetical protein SD70_09015 [Paenibacillus sp. VKM B-2647]
MDQYYAEVYSEAMFADLNKTPGPTFQQGHVCIAGVPVAISYWPYRGQALLEGDIVLSSEEQMAAYNDYIAECATYGKQPDPDDKRTVHFKRPWPDKVVYYMFDSSITQDLKDGLVGAMTELTQLLGNAVTFKQRIMEDHFIIYELAEDGYSSSVGMIGGEQFVRFPADYEKGILFHEMLHAIGLTHDQTKPARATTITINDAAVIPGLVPLFDIVQDPEELAAPSYDPNSIMHCGPQAFGQNGARPLSRSTRPCCRQASGKHRRRAISPRCRSCMQPREQKKMASRKQEVIFIVRAPRTAAPNCAQACLKFVCRPNRSRVQPAPRNRSRATTRTSGYRALPHTAGISAW